MGNQVRYLIEAAIVGLQPCSTSHCQWNCSGSSACCAREIVSQAQDADAPIFLKREKRLVAGNDDLRPTCERAFEDAVVGRVLQYGETPARLHHRTDVGEKEGDAGELFRVACKLSGKNTEQLRHDRPR